MTIVEIEFYEDGTVNISPEEAFYMAYPECMPFWRKVKLIVLYVFRWVEEAIK